MEEKQLLTNEKKKEYSIPEMEILQIDKSEGIICASCPYNCDCGTD